MKSSRRCFSEMFHVDCFRPLSACHTFLAVVGQRSRSRRPKSRASGKHICALVASTFATDTALDGVRTPPGLWGSRRVRRSRTWQWRSGHRTTRRDIRASPAVAGRWSMVGVYTATESWRKGAGKTFLVRQVAVSLCRDLSVEQRRTVRPTMQVTGCSTWSQREVEVLVGISFTPFPIFPQGHRRRGRTSFCSIMYHNGSAPCVWPISYLLSLVPFTPSVRSPTANLPPQVLQSVWSVIVTVYPDMFSVLVAPFEGLHGQPYLGNSYVDSRDLFYDPRGWWRHAPALCANARAAGSGRLHRLARGISATGLPRGAGSLNEPLVGNKPAVENGVVDVFSAEGSWDPVFVIAPPRLVDFQNQTAAREKGRLRARHVAWRRLDGPKVKRT